MKIKEIEAEIAAKAARIRTRNYSNQYIADRCEHYYALYKFSVLENAGTTEYYIIYKAYQTIAKERGLWND